MVKEETIFAGLKKTKKLKQYVMQCVIILTRQKSNLFLYWRMRLRNNQVSKNAITFFSQPNMQLGGNNIDKRRVLSRRWCLLEEKTHYVSILDNL